MYMYIYIYVFICTYTHIYIFSECRYTVGVIVKYVQVCSNA